MRKKYENDIKKHENEITECNNLLENTKKIIQKQIRDLQMNIQTNKNKLNRQKCTCLMDKNDKEMITTTDIVDSILNTDLYELFGKRGTTYTLIRNKY